MTRHRIATLAIALVGITTSFSAHATVRERSVAGQATSANREAAPCSTPDSSQCAAYQRRLLQIVEDEQLNGRDRPTMAEVGRHQLDALIASVN